jgi:anti-sigma regulatory factor (Ser/Thr protein kinase)
MEGNRQKSEKIRLFILDNISFHPADIVKIAAQRFSISRQAAARHIKRLVNQGDIETEGNTSGRIYRPSQGRFIELTYAITDRPEAQNVWSKDILPLLRSLPDNVIELWNYCFIEIFKNGIDHSGGTTIRVQIIHHMTQTTINISDNGKGLFNTIRKKFRLKDDQHAALELSKGKLVAESDNHTGEDIFLSSRMTDHFTVISGKVTFSHQYGITWDWALDVSNEKKTGTLVSILIENNTSRTTAQVFDEYASQNVEGHSFIKTCVPVRLSQYSAETLFSRSQARRFLSCIERFKVAILDFHGIEKIGPAFADQIFRVFSSEHPDIQLLHCNANKQVEIVIQAAKNNSAGFV